MRCRKWLPSINELLQLIGGGGFMATPSRADLDGPLREEIDRYYQSAGADAERRIQLFRLAWDYIGSDLGGRGELYERFYLSDSWRMTALAYKIADKAFAESLVEQFLGETGVSHGYSLPLSPGGRASLVPAPPWHYVGDFLVVEYWADPEAVARRAARRASSRTPMTRAEQRRCSSTGSRARTRGGELLDPAAASTRSSSSS